MPGTSVHLSHTHTVQTSQNSLNESNGFDFVCDGLYMFYLSIFLTVIIIIPFNGFLGANLTLSKYPKKDGIDSYSSFMLF